MSVFEYDMYTTLTGGALLIPVIPPATGPYIPAQLQYNIYNLKASTIGLRINSKVFLYSEYGKVCCRKDGDASPVPPTYTSNAVAVRSQEAYYATIGVRGRMYTPHYTYAYQDYDTNFLPGRMPSHGLGLNVQIDSSVILKFDYTMSEARGGRAQLNATGDAETISIGLDSIF